MASASDIQSSVQIRFPFLFGRHPFCNHGTPSEVLASLAKNPVRFLVARGLFSGHFRVRPRMAKEDCFRPGAIYHNSTLNLQGVRSAPASRDSPWHPLCGFDRELLGVALQLGQVVE